VMGVGQRLEKAVKKNTTSRSTWMINRFITIRCWSVEIDLQRQDL
jgi:hypothetical protein